MDFLAHSQERYTTKKFDSTRKLSNEQIDQLKEILRLSPSSINSQPWKFTFVSEEEKKKEFAKVSYFNGQKIEDASHLVIFSVTSDLDFFEAQIEAHLPEGAVGYYKQFLKPQDSSVVNKWLSNQVYISLGVFLSACATMGIDATPMEGIENEQYDKLLGQHTHKTLFAVAIGKRAEDDANQPNVKPKSRLPQHLVIEEL